MKKIFSVLMVIASIAVGGLAFVESNNFILGFLTSFATSSVLQYATGIHLQSISATTMVLAGIKTTQAGTPNPGGGRKLWVIAKDQFEEDWGHLAVEGEIALGPELVALAGFVEFEVADNSLKLDQALKGAVGYQAFETAFEVKVAGDYKAQTAAVEKLINTEVVAVIQLNDLQRKSVGSTIFPLTFEINHTTGAKGNDQRGWTFKAKQDGLPKPSYFLKSDIVLPFLA